MGPNISSYITIEFVKKYKWIDIHSRKQELGLLFYWKHKKLGPCDHWAKKLDIISLDLIKSIY